MNRLSITRNGFRASRWDTDTGGFAGVEVDTYVSQLRTECSIEPGVTLGDIFEAVELDEPLKLFLRRYSWCDVDAFHAEARAPLAEPSKLECIELSKHVDLYEERTEVLVKVRGIGEPWAEGRTNYGLDFTPVNELAPLPVRLNPVFEVRRDDEMIAQAPAVFTLLDVLGEIYWEISFHGSPVDRDERVGRLRSAGES